MLFIAPRFKITCQPVLSKNEWTICWWLRCIMKTGSKPKFHQWSKKTSTLFPKYILPHYENQKLATNTTAMIIEGNQNAILQRSCSNVENWLEILTSSNTGTLPPTKPVLPPCGTTAKDLELQYWRISETCQHKFILCQKHLTILIAICESSDHTKWLQGFRPQS